MSREHLNQFICIIVSAIIFVAGGLWMERRSAGALKQAWPVLLHAMRTPNSGAERAALNGPIIRAMGRSGELVIDTSGPAAELRLGQMGGAACKVVRTLLSKKTAASDFQKIQFSLNGILVANPKVAEDFDCDARGSTYALRIKSIDISH